MTIQNYKRNVLLLANNKIRLDDEAQRKSISKVVPKLWRRADSASDHLEWMPENVAQEGFELRTDLWGTVRAKKGIFIAPTRRTRRRQVRKMARR